MSFSIAKQSGEVDQPLCCNGTVRAVIMLLGITAAACAQAGIPLELQAETRLGKLMGEALPRAALPSQTADRLNLHHEPAYQTPTPLYRQLAVGDPPENFAVVVDPGPEPRLWVDLNRNGDLADDYIGSVARDADGDHWDVTIPAQFGGKPTVLPYRMWLLPGNVVDAQPRYGQIGTATLAGKSYSCVVQPAETDGRGIVLGIDLNHDGRVDGNTLSGEKFDGALPFNIEGRTYKLVRASSGQFGLEESDAEVDPKRHIAIGELAPDFSFTTLSGQSDRLRAHNKSWMLLDFWASWCRPCWDEIPRLRAVLEGQKSGGVDILGISLEGGAADGQSPSGLRDFVRSRQISWPVVYDNPGFSTSVARLYNVDALPVYVLIDPQGVIRWIGREGVDRHVRETVR